MNMLFETIGVIASVCTSISFIPQAIKTFKTKDVSGLSVLMYSIFNLGMFSWFIYGIYLKSYQMIFANFLCLCFSFPILLMIIKYGNKGSKGNKPS